MNLNSNATFLASLAAAALAAGQVKVTRIAAHVRSMSEHDMHETVNVVRDERALAAFERRLASTLKGERA